MLLYEHDVSHHRALNQDPSGQDEELCVLNLLSKFHPDPTLVNRLRLYRWDMNDCKVVEKMLINLLGKFEVKVIAIEESYVDFTIISNTYVKKDKILTFVFSKLNLACIPKDTL
ncbi:hypothetical protein CR513_32660, partial [Mucuna pruriens]